VRALIVTWPGGGNVQPAIGLGRLLVERGHDVRVFGSSTLALRVAVAGCRLEPWPPELEIDPAVGHAFEDQWDRIYRDILLGPGFGAAVGSVLAAEATDVVIVDIMLRSAMFAVERAGLPLVHLVHMTYRHNAERSDADDPDAEWGWRWAYMQHNRARAAMGLEPLPVGPVNAGLALVHRSAAALVVMPREFDDWPNPPANVTHVGPIFEEPTAVKTTQPTWDSPWPADDARPLVVISLGSTYMHQEDLLARISGAAAGPDRRVVLLTGNDLAPADLPGVAEGVAIRRFVPHAAILPDAALVITHGGMGTLMAAFAAGVPTICFPLGRDQDSNAQRASELGTSITLPADAAPSSISDAIDRALASPTMLAAARRMQIAVSGYDGGRLAVDELERAVTSQVDTFAGR
jgi:MGT family glycosyltransferase